MNVIYKYLIPLRASQVIHNFDLPQGAKVVHVGAQDQENVLIWVEQKVEHPDHEGPRERRAFRVYGTGYEIYPSGVIGHIGSVVVDSYVWHVYEVVST